METSNSTGGLFLEGFVTIINWRNQDYSGLSWEIQHTTSYSTPCQPVIHTVSSTKSNRSHAAWKLLQRNAKSYSGRQRGSSALLCPEPGMLGRGRGDWWRQQKGFRSQGVGKKCKSTSFDNSVIMPDSWQLLKKNLWWHCAEFIWEYQ